MKETTLKNKGLRRCQPLPCGYCRQEAPPGFEPGMKVLQTSALPLGYGAMMPLPDGLADGDGWFHGIVPKRRVPS